MLFTPLPRVPVAVEACLMCREFNLRNKFAALSGLLSKLANKWCKYVIPVSISPMFKLKGELAELRKNRDVSCKAAWF